MSAKDLQTQGYMAHVDGLRCVAVISVLLFHFGLPGLEGGYVGVDIFFVISGYLITRLIANEVMSTGRFDFAEFYSRRIRRIIPALLATLFVTASVSVFSLTPSDLVSFGKSLAASALSLSNFLFWSESGYFDAASKTKPLLHTWSLSVEEQFYLFWPAFLLLCYKINGRRGLLVGVLLAGFGSFAANNFAVSAARVGYQSDLFFLPHYRVFEFAIGAIGWFILDRLPKGRNTQDLMAVIGAALVVGSVVFMREGVVFPYTNALVPCLGAFLIIASGNSRFVGFALANPISVWFGKISYSLYLVHWPIVVFTEQYMSHYDLLFKFILMSVLSLLCAVVLHYMVEVRFRYAGSNSTMGRRRVVGATAASSLAIASIGFVFLGSNGMMWRYEHFTPGSLGFAEASKSGDGVDRSATPVEEKSFVPLSASDVEAGKARRFEDLAYSCSIDRLDDMSRCDLTRPLQVLVFGNSHEPDAFNAFFHLYGRSQEVNLISFGTVNDCDVEVGIDYVRSSTSALGCDSRFAVLSSDSFLESIDVIIYNTHQGFDPVAAELWKILAMAKSRYPGIHIFALGSYLQTSVDCASLYNTHRSDAACKDEKFVNYFNPDERLATTVPEVGSLDYTYMSKYLLLCKDGLLNNCATFENGELAFYDQHHFSRGFAWYLGDRIAEVFSEELAQAGFPALPHPRVH